MFQTYCATLGSNTVQLMGMPAPQALVASATALVVAAEPPRLLFRRLVQRSGGVSRTLDGLSSKISDRSNQAVGAGVYGVMTRGLLPAANVVF